MRKNQLLFFVGKSDWVSIASDGVTSGVQSALIASQRAAQGVEPLYSSVPKGSFTQTLLSSNQVEAAAMNDKPNFNGLRASYVDSPEQLNAKNGGLNAGYGDALGNGVVYDKDQYMKGMTNAAKTATNFAAEGVQQANKPKGDWGFYFDSESRKGQNGTTAPQGSKYVFNKYAGIPSNDITGALLSVGEKGFETAGRVSAISTLSRGPAENLFRTQINKISTLPYEDAEKVMGSASESGKSLATYGKVATGFKVVGGVAGFGGMAVDTYQAADGTKLETFAGSSASTAVGAVGLEGSILIGATAFSFIPVYGTLFGGLVGGGAFLFGYEFKGGSSYVKATTTNALLKFNGKEYNQTR